MARIDEGIQLVSTQDGAGSLTHLEDGPSAPEPEQTTSPQNKEKIVWRGKEVKDVSTPVPLEYPKDYVSCFSFFFLVAPIILHVTDVVLDILLAVSYYKSKQMLYCWLTIFFVQFPTLFSLYVDYAMAVPPDQCRSAKLPSLFSRAYKATEDGWWLKTVWIFTHFTHLEPVIRYCFSIYYGYKSRRKSERIPSYSYLMLRNDDVVGRFQVCQCFLETVPQTILQIVIVFEGEGGVFAFLRIGFSLLAIPLSMATWSRRNHFLRNNASCTLTVLEYWLYYFMISLRIVSIACIAGVLPVWTALFFAIHFLFMTALMLLNEPTLHGVRDQGEKDRIMNILFANLCAAVYFVTNLTPMKGTIRDRYHVDEVLFVVENLAALIFWALYTDRTAPHFLPLAYISLFLFIFGIISMIVWLKYFDLKL